MAAFEAKITLSAVDKATPIFKKITGSINKLKESTEKVRASMSKLGDATKKIGGSVAKMTAVATGAGLGLYALAKQTGNATWEIKNNAKVVGLSTEKYQQWAYAFDNYTSVGEGGLKRLTGQLNKLAVTAANDPTSDIAKGFRSIGISAKDSSGKVKDSFTLLTEFSDVYAKMTNASQKRALLQTYFGGRMGPEIAALLEHGSSKIGAEGYDIGLKGILADAKYYGTYSDEDIEQSQKAGNAIWDIEMKMKKLGKTVAIAVSPAITNLAEKFSKYIEGNEALIKQNVVGFFKSVVSAVKGAIKVFDKISAAIKPVIKLFGGLENVIIALSVAYGVTLVAGLFKAGVAFSTFSLALLANPYVAFIAATGVAILALNELLDKMGAYEKASKAMEVIDDVKAIKNQGVMSWLKEVDEKAAERRRARGDVILPDYLKPKNGEIGIAFDAFPKQREERKVKTDSLVPTEPLIPKLAGLDKMYMEVQVKVDHEARVTAVNATTKSPNLHIPQVGMLMP
jgi:hypothetical protein